MRCARRAGGLSALRRLSHAQKQVLELALLGRRQPLHEGRHRLLHDVEHIWAAPSARDDRIAFVP